MKRAILSALALGLFAGIPLPGGAARADGPETVIATYRVKQGMEEEFAKVLGKHWPTLRRLGLVLDRPHLVLRGTDEANKTYFVEILTWKDHETPDHVPPEVQKIWASLNALVEDRLGHRAIEFPEVTPVELPK